MQIPARYPGRPAVVIGTGPSLEPFHVKQFQAAGFVMFGVNAAWEFRPEVHVTTNPEWWEHEAEPEVFLMMPAVDCWCSDWRAAERWGLNHFDWKDDAEHRGLSADPSLVSLGHGSGFAALNIAFLMGCSPIILLGHDMKYPDGYNAAKRDPGGKRHYFGEYKKPNQHWPSMRVGPRGELQGLIDCYETVAQQMRDKLRHVEIINCTPGGALECFPRKTTDEVIDGIAIRASTEPARAG